MKSGSRSCLGTILLMIVAFALIKFLFPELWTFLFSFSIGLIAAGLVVVVLLLGALGYFTYRNLKGNKQKEAARKSAKALRLDEVYQSIQKRLEQAPLLNQIPSEEWLRVEMLMGGRVAEMKSDLIRLKDLTAVANIRATQNQLSDHRRQLNEAHDEAVRNVIRENIRLVEEKSDRLRKAEEEIKQNEASLDLIYYSLLKVDEDLKMGRSVQSLLPADVYKRFEIATVSDEEKLPPLEKKSSTIE
jgi:hypothetical protein